MKKLTWGLFFLGGISFLSYLLGEVIDAIGAALHWLGRLLGLLGLVRPLPLGLSVLLVGIGVALWRSSFPYRAHRIMREWLRVREGAPRRERPRLRWAWPRNRHIWVVAWKMPVGPTVERLNQNSAVMDEQIDASTRYWFERGWIWMEAGRAKLPSKIDFAQFAGSVLPKQKTRGMEVIPT
jgi:hypothetical protein